jgi:hypothetical protein
MVKITLLANDGVAIPLSEAAVALCPFVADIWGGGDDEITVTGADSRSPGAAQTTTSPWEPICAYLHFSAGVNGRNLTRAVEFLEYRSSHGFTSPSRPLRTKRTDDAAAVESRGDLAKSGIEAWYITYIDAYPIMEVFELLYAADFLRVEDLMDLAAAKLAQHYLRTCTTPLCFSDTHPHYLIPAEWSPAQLSRIFWTGREWTPAEVAKLRDENPWIEHADDMPEELRTELRRLNVLPAT